MNKLIQNLSMFPVKSLSFKAVFYKRSEEKSQPKIRYRHVNPIYPPPGLNLKLPGSLMKKQKESDKNIAF